jgi:hypothetical protein
MMNPESTTFTASVFRRPVAPPIGTCIAFLSLLIAVPATAPAAAECRVETHSLNAIEPVFDGNWQGIAVASDGRCYFGASTHSPHRGVGFFRFDPVANALSVVAPDLTVVAGYDPAKTVPQGKIHSPIVEADGSLYFTTHLANYWTEARDSFPGAHVMGYHLASGKFRDFGVVRPRYSIYSAIGVDPKRRQLTVFAVPFADADVESGGCHVYRIDIGTGRKTDLGRVGEPGRRASFWMFVDQRGDCWFSIWRDDGTLYQVLADSGRIIRHEHVLPAAMQADGRAVDERRNARRSWTWVEPLPGREQALFTMGHSGGLDGGTDERLWLFDPSRPLKEGEAFKPVAEIGSTFLSMARGGERVYFVQYRELADARNGMPERFRDRDPATLGFPAELHLRSIAIGPRASRLVTDHGRIVDQDGRMPRMIESLAADAEGRVYMSGSWTIKDPREATMQYVWEGQDFWPDAAPGEFKRMNRGEFLGVVRLGEPRPGANE